MNLVWEFPYHAHLYSKAAVKRIHQWLPNYFLVRQSRGLNVVFCADADGGDGVVGGTAAAEGRSGET